MRSDARKRLDESIDRLEAATQLHPEHIGVLCQNEIILAAYAHAKVYQEPEESDAVLARADAHLIAAVCNALNRYGILAARRPADEDGLRADDPARALAEKVIRLAQTNAILARAGGRSTDERRWLDLIHAMEADVALWDRAEIGADDA